MSGIKNDGDTPTTEGVPGHSIAMIVDGGEVADIAKTIFLKKAKVSELMAPRRTTI